MLNADAGTLYALAIVMSVMSNLSTGCNRRPQALFLRGGGIKIEPKVHFRRTKKNCIEMQLSVNEDECRGVKRPRIKER